MTASPIKENCGHKHTKPERMKKFFLVVFAFFSAVLVTRAQSSNKQDIPLVRMYFHEKIDSTQILITRYDGKPMLISSLQMIKNSMSASMTLSWKKWMHYKKRLKPVNSQRIMIRSGI
jgi:hypothetical protein